MTAHFAESNMLNKIMCMTLSILISANNLNFEKCFTLLGAKGAVCGLRGTYPAGVGCVCAIQKPEKCHLFLPSPRHACPCHDPWKSLWTAKSCKGKKRVPNAITGTNQLRELTPTENPRSSKVVGVKHKASNLVS